MSTGALSLLHAGDRHRNASCPGACPRGPTCHGRRDPCGQGCRSGTRRSARARRPAPSVAAAAAFRAPHPARARPMKVAEPVSEDLSSETDLGVELRVLWGDTLIEAGTFRAAGTPVLVGETPGCALRLAGADLPVAEFPMLRHESGDYRVTFARGMTGILDEKGKRTSLAKLVREHKATADDKIDGAYTVVVPRAGAVRVELGSRLAIEARARRPMEVKGAPFWERINYQFLNLFLVLLRNNLLFYVSQYVSATAVGEATSSADSLAGLSLDAITDDVLDNGIQIIQNLYNNLGGGDAIAKGNVLVQSVKDAIVTALGQ